MENNGKSALVKVVLADYGHTYADAIGIRLKPNSPAALFQLLYSAMLLSARIPADNAVRASKALRKAGLSTPRKMAGATWQDRVDVITWHGYKRYDERTASMLGEMAELLLDRYAGDLRQLREEAECDVAREHELLQQFKGIGPVGADIFLREVQAIWDEVYPYADNRVLKAAKRLQLGNESKQLAKLVRKTDFPHFVAGLIRIDLQKAYDDVREQAA